jgi:NADH-quinone oxidoreductase subunit L
MDASFLIQIFVLIPIMGFIISLLVPGKAEKLISRIAFGTVGLNLLSATIFIGFWIYQKMPVLNLKDFVLLKTEGYEFFVDFCFDTITAVYLLVGSVLTFLVTIYSRYYLHREEGYKRFFNTLLFFYLAYNLVVISGNFETMFIGWEMLGISSFLLIAFYRDRYLPVKNAVKVFSIYRVGDVGFILVMWMSHHLWHENITFVKLSDEAFVNTHLATHSWIGVFISLMILISAAAKSAQLPFSSWLPRAMEGPTPSSAIFYGSLSVHIGVFLLLRTFPFWEHQFSIRILIGVLGLATSLVATGIARVQSSIKSQVAYSSIAQIGLIFIEVAAGWQTLALIHFAGNAFLRTYQLLVSPSVVSYLIREQFYNFVPREHTVEDSLPKRIEYSIYLLCLKEWNLDSFMYRYLWNPMKWAGNKLGFLTVKRVLLFFVTVTVLGLILRYSNTILPIKLYQKLPFVFGLIGVVMVLKSFTERKNVLASLILVAANHVMIALSVSFNENFNADHTVLYLSGVIAFGIVGYLSIVRLKGFEGEIDLDRFHGYAYAHPRIAFTFLLACLGIAGFPISPTFVGEDLIFTHIHEHQYGLAFLVALSFILDGLALIRIYARVFLGPHVKSMYEMAYRSS